MFFHLLKLQVTFDETHAQSKQRDKFNHFEGDIEKVQVWMRNGDLQDTKYHFSIFAAEHITKHGKWKTENAT